MIDLSKFTWLRIEPADAWFFRDGRPSNRGEDQSDIESEFPPNPATVVGALRAALARANGWNGQGSWVNQKEELKQVLGDGFDNLGELGFAGPFLAQNDRLLFPMPRHVAGYRFENAFIPVALLEPSTDPVATDCGDIRLPVLLSDWKARVAGIDGLTDQQRQKPPEPRSDLFVTTDGLSKILRGELPHRDDCRHRSDLFQLESRVGIVRDADSRTTGRNAMYSPRYVRLNEKKNVTLTMAVSGVPSDWTLPRLMALGGESRMALVEPLSSPPELPQVAAGKAAVAVALSPAKFDSNWWGAGPGDPASQLAADLTGQVTCVALDRPRLIGGWDFNSGPRPLSPFAPAGTVWWLSESTSDATLTQFGINTNYGYGLVAVS